MASPELAIAKAAFSASLFRADPASISRPSVDAFFQLLNSTLTQCSRPNVQNCKDYILNNIVYSTGRTTSLAKYLVALSKSQTDDSARSRPSGKRRRLHVLYLVNDVLHHVVQKQVNQREFSVAWDPYIPSLFSCAASFDNCPKHSKKLEDLIDLWQERNYVADDLIPKLKEALTSGAVSTTPPRAGTDSSLKLAKDAPYVLPSFHGDAATPWYDLPAASWLPHLVPNSTKPMLPDLIRPIQLAAGPASKALTDAVKALLCDADRIFSKDKKPNDDPHVDINELGERIVLDELTGDIISGETYYGWSRDFCKRMKDRKDGRLGPRGRSDSRSFSRTRSPSRSRKRSYSRSRSRGRRRSTSLSPSYKRRRVSRSRSSRSRSYSPSRSPSRDRSRNRSRNRSALGLGRRSRPRSHSRSFSPSSPPPRRSNGGEDRGNLRHSPLPAPLDPPYISNDEPTLGLSIPPRPKGYQGPWPPPPPPPPPPNLGATSSGWMQNHSFAAHVIGSWGPVAGAGVGPSQVPPPPPPPLPPHSHPSQLRSHHTNHSGGSYDDGYRGQGGFQGGGSGGYGRGF